MKRFLALLLCLAMLASFAGCNEAPESAVTTQPTETTAPPTTQPEPTAAEVYAEAAEALRSREDVRMSVVYAREMKVGVDTFKETIQQDLTLRGIGTDAFCSKLEETWYNGSLGTLTNEVFKDGTMYCELNYDRFSAEMTGEEYLDRMLPAVLLDAALYETVEQEGNDFLFSGATELEEWVGGYYAWDISAEGTVKTDGKGNITESVYQAQYAQGTSEVTLKVTVKIKEDEGDAIEVPAKADTYILQDTPDGPGIVRRVIGYLLQADSVESNYLETATLEAAAVAGVTMMEISSWGRTATQAAKFDQTYQLVSLKDGDTEEEYTWEETYVDGTLSVSENGKKPTQEKMSPSDIRTTVDNWLLSSTPDALKIMDYNLKQIGDVLILEYTMDPASSEATVDRILDNYLVDPDGYRESSTRYSSREAKGVLCLDASTLLPLAATKNISATHTIDGKKQATSLEIRQDFRLGFSDAYEIITGEPLAEEEPETKPTPLFYHVTGSEGQEMWLLGTIHVGDVRTKYLPQEIYDAFDASDALALEFESEAFLEQSMSDEELMSQIRQAYLYSDGTLLDDHISDEQLYKDTIRMLEVTGQYSQMMLLCKPYFVGQMVSSFLEDRSMVMDSDYGVDFQLEDRANEQDKEIRSVETGLSQLQMLANFSDELQEQMLEESIYYGHVGSGVAASDLFEMWCRGDEAELREYINSEPEDMTEDEKRLHEEYEKAISTDRDKGMVEVAKGYLEGGDTVFYAVGLAHLLADDGLVDSLRAAGYTVELVSYE